MNKKKWQVVEEIVASLFKDASVTIEKNKRLKSIRRNEVKAGYREVDVLVSGKLAGQMVNIVIECKDKAKKVGSPEIDAFIGKLQDIGLPTQTSIFITTGRFSKHAISRATDVGMKTLILDEKNLSSTKRAILSAIQSRIFMLCSIKNIGFLSDDRIPDENFKFFDKNGKFYGTLPDLIWNVWTKFPQLSTCGEYSCEIQIPEEIKYMENGAKNSIRNIAVVYKVTAFLYREEGKVESYSLKNAETEKVEKFLIQSKFSNDESKQVPLHIDSEKALHKLINESGNIKVTFNRVKLPKIVMNKGLLWPPSKSMVEYYKNFGPSISEDNLDKISTSPLNTFWDFDDAYSDLKSSGKKVNIKITKLA